MHIDHGIGRYRGLKDVDIGEEANEFLHLEYANSANLYVPVSQLACINRYCGSDPENAPLHVLGSERWNKEKTKAIKQVRDTAAKLLGLYAKRAAKKDIHFNLTRVNLKNLVMVLNILKRLIKDQPFKQLSKI